VLKKPLSVVFVAVVFSLVLVPRGQANQVPIDYGKLPLRFEPNDGQIDARVHYLARAKRYTVFLTSDAAVLSARSVHGTVDDQGAVVRMRFLGANPAPAMQGTKRLSSYSNYFVGKNSKEWRTGVPNYAEVQASNLYPGIAVHYYGNEREMEYDLIVEAGANPDSIRIGLEGPTPAEIDSSGNAAVKFGDGEFQLHKPVVYQLDGRGKRTVISGSYVLSAANELRFKIGEYDHSRNLIIDPVLSYSTYLGGSLDDVGFGVAVDSSGHAYVTGWSDSTNFPLVNAYQPQDNSSLANVFLTKFSADGKSVIFSTYLGGSDSFCGGDYGRAVVVDAAGEAYVAGVAYSSNFPVTSNAYKKSGGGCGEGGEGGSGFVTRFSADGQSLLYSTYFGGDNFHFPTQILTVALDALGSAYFAGFDQTGQLATPGAFQASLDAAGEEGAFVGKLSPDGSSLSYCTYLRALRSGTTSAASIAVDVSGNAYVTGLAQTNNFPTTPGAFQRTFGGVSDAFVTVVNPAGSGLVYSTYLGGSDDDYGNGIAVDSNGSVYLTGTASSTDFPTTPGSFQSSYPGGTAVAFVAKLASNGKQLAYSTYLGGSQGSGGTTEIAIGPHCRRNCSVTVFGNAWFNNFPLKNPIQTSGDLFVSILNPAGTQLGSYSTLVGSPSGDQPAAVALDAHFNVYVAGYTSSAAFPTTPGAFQPSFGGENVWGDAYLAKIGVK
jgi:hypothetical protein